MTDFKKQSSPLPVISWSLYNFVNAIFSAVVLTAYFPLFFTDLAKTHWLLGLATALPMIGAGLAVPFLGALSDQTGKTKTYLIRSTLTALLLLSFLSVFRRPWLLILCFSLACFFFHASVVFYQSLFPVVAHPKEQGRVSGLSTGLGYLGIAAILPLAHWVERQFGIQAVFAAVAGLLLFFSFPVFRWVPERTVKNPVAFRWGLWHEEWQRGIKTAATLPKRPALLLFFGGNFFVMDALNTLIFWFMVYAREVFHPSQDTLIVFLLSVNLAAFMFGFLSGFLTDRIGSMPTLILAAASLALTFISLVWVHHFTLFFWISLTGGAFAIAGIWTAGRKALLGLTGPEKIGEHFGIYVLTTKLSVLGSVFFSVIADLFGFKQALQLVIFPASAGTFFLILSAFFQRAEESDCHFTKDLEL